MKNYAKRTLLLLVVISFCMLSQAAEWLDVTSMYITNPGYDNNSNQGWQISGYAGSMKCDYGAQEFWQGFWDCYQRISIPSGHYRLSVNGYYRSQANSTTAVANYKSEEMPCMLYANESMVPFKHVYSESLNFNYANGCWRYSSGGGGGGGWGGTWYPNNMASADYCFEQAMYLNELVFDYNTNDGDLYIGVLNNSYTANNWCIFDNWKLEVYTTLVKVISIGMSQTSATLVPGEKLALTATVRPSTATYRKVTWSSLNESVATVDENGVITAVSEGTASIRATAIDGTGRYGTCRVTVANNTEGMDQLTITEIDNANIDQIYDPSHNFGGWVELYNPTGMGISLLGCWVSDDLENLQKVHIITPIVVPARGYRNLWFDHHDYYTLSQMNMKLDAEGGTIYLSDSDGNLLTCQQYPAGVSRCSFARQSVDSDVWGITATPTPEASNDGVVFSQMRLEAPQVDSDSQIFSGAMTVHVAIPEGATLLYTTDGAAPSKADGLLSADGVFTIDRTTTLRLCLYADGYLPSPVVTRSYIADDKDFGLPVISVVGNSWDLFGNENGVFVKGVNGRPGNGQSSPCNWNMDWERPVNFEYLVDNKMVVNQETSLERCGGWSRAWAPYSFKLKANKLYEGQSSLPYQFFATKPYLKHKTLQIRNGGNDTNCRIKDPALQEIVRSSGLNIDVQAYQPVMHYFNGMYAGVINMREPNNKHYIYANYGLDDEEIDQFEMSPDSGYVQKCGTYASMQRWYELAEKAADSYMYGQIKKMVDIDEYCNYMAVELYLGGTDWPQNNVKGFKPIMEGGKFRFVLFDLDGTFATSSPFTTFANKKNYTFDKLYGNEADGIVTGSQISREIEFVTIFLNMLQNDEFRKKFVDTFCLVAGSVFEPSRCASIINQMASNVATYQSQYSEIYGNGYSPWNTANTLISNLSASRQTTLVNAMKNYELINLRYSTSINAKLSSNLPEARIFVNDMPVPTNKFSGTLFPPITLRAQAPAGYEFVGWKDSNDNIVSTDETYKCPSYGNVSVVACYQASTDEEHTLAPIVVNEVSAANSINVNDYYKKDDWVELYNTTDNDIDLAGMYLTDKSDKPMKYQISAGDGKASTVIPAHGYKIIWCSKRESDTELHANFKLDNEDGAMVRIMAEDGSWADSLVYCTHNGDQAVGRYPDGGKDVYLMTRTSIMASNQMTSYAKWWEYVAPDDETALDNVLATRSAGMSIACVGNTLHIKSEEATSVTLYIHSVNGVTIATSQLETEGGHAQASVANLPSGVYVASVVDQDGNSCATKFRK